jgi:hypothetical protein
MSEQEFQPKDEQPVHDPLYQERMAAKHRSDRLSSLTWALILIWAGMVFMAVNFGWLDTLRTSVSLPAGFTLDGMTTWSVIFLGAGVLIFIEALVRTFSKNYRSSTGGSYVLAAVFLGMGLSTVFGWQAVWPFVLIAMGVSALIGALVSR